ncbi:hypothetical protein J7L48_07490, partial [bacterium]|nr:hypothetical protein [bacterium]
MKKILMTLILIILVSQVFSQKLTTSQMINMVNDNIENNNYEEGLKIISTAVLNNKMHNSFLVDRAFYIFSLYNDKTAVSDFITKTFLPTKNPFILNQAFLECYKNKYYKEAMNILYFLIEKNIHINMSYRPYISRIVNNIKEDEKFDAYIKKIIKNRSKDDNVRFFLLSLISNDEKEHFLLYFNKNTTQFKSFLLGYYFETNKNKFKKLYSSLRNDTFGKRVNYIKILFSLGQYRLVLNMVNKSDDINIGKDFLYNGIFQTILDSYILLNEYKGAVKFLLKFPNKFYILS